jgi:hypothetical protein
VPGTTGRPAEILRVRGSIRVSASQQFQAKGFYWFWLCSGSVAMVALFGILALVAQFFYWADIVKKLNDRLVEGSGHRDID